MSQKAAPFKFKGFSKPNYTQVPDEFFDRVMMHLSGAELKVILYIFRKTFGFKKSEDSISLSQICTGQVNKKTGERFDEGTGLSKSTAIIALRGLIDKGLITAVQHKSQMKGFESTTYTPRYKDADIETDIPMSENQTRAGTKTAQGLVRKSDIQETAKQKTIKQSNFEYSMIKNSEKKERERKGPSSLKDLMANRTQSLSKIAVSHLDEPKWVSEDKGIPGERSTHAGGLQPVKTSPRFKGAVEDISNVLGDAEHLPSNFTQAKNIYTFAVARFKANEEWFIQAMYTAKGLVKERIEEGRIRTSPMAYFFTVLRDRLKLGAT